MSTDADLVAIAAELYSGPLADFTAARNTRARAAEDAALAADIRALRKPSVAAWVVNVFARERAAQLEEALALAADLREAQADLDARALARLGRDRRALTARLAAAAADLASSRGERVTASTRDAVQQTISAAFFDPDAAAAVASGRLVRELEPAGTFADVMDTIVGGGAPTAATAAALPADEVAARRERKKAERALHEAEQTRDRVVREHARAQTAAEAADNRIAELTTRATELEHELSIVRRDLDGSRDDARSAGAAVKAAHSHVSDAEDAVARAERALASLRLPEDGSVRPSH
jgi:hypothetical protein